MVYNTTNITDATNIYSIFEGANQLTNSYLAVAILLILFILILIMFSNRMDTKGLFVLSSFLMIVVSILFWKANLIGIHILFVPFGLFVASVVIYWTMGND